MNAITSIILINTSSIAAQDGTHGSEWEDNDAWNDNDQWID